MPKNRIPQALIISDKARISRSLENDFSRIGWRCDTVSVTAMMGSASAAAVAYRALVLVIDADFLKRFGGVVEEMAAMFRNCSRHCPLYLICEDTPQAAVFPLLAHARRHFNWNETRAAGLFESKAAGA